VVGVVVVDEDRLADEGLVGRLDLLGRELVEVVVAPAGDGALADVQEAGTGLVVELMPMASLVEGCAALHQRTGLRGRGALGHQNAARDPERRKALERHGLTSRPVSSLRSVRPRADRRETGRR
jgi:hypothetical protein